MTHGLLTAIVTETTSIALNEKSMVATAALLLSADYLAVVAASVADLWSALQRSRRLGMPRTSRGYRRTIDKVFRYMMALFSLSIIDGLLIGAIIALRLNGGWSLPPFPLLTTVGALCMCMIEAKSVMENSQKASAYTDALKSAAQLLESDEIKHLLESISKAKAMLKDVKELA